LISNSFKLLLSTRKMTTFFPLVSVIIPSYNAAAFIRETVYSVLDQTYSNIEVIVVDDGSKDNTAEILQEFGNKIHYHRQVNAGVSQARNKGFGLSKGEYVCFLDADDWLFPNTIAEKVQLMESDASLGIVYGRVEVTDMHLKPTGEILYPTAGKNLVELLCRFKWPIPCPSNVLFRRKVLDDVGLFDPQLSTSADYDMWLRVCSIYETGVIPRLSVKYRKHGSNMSSNISRFKKDMELIIKKCEGNGLLTGKNLSRLKSNYFLLLAKLLLYQKDWTGIYYLSDFIKYRFLKK